MVGMGKDTRAIGRENGLLWHVPDDLKRFKRLTMGYPVIMGRKTFESIIDILGTPFPGRTNIVVTRNPDYQYDGVVVVDSLAAAFEAAESEDPAEIHIGGGAQLYQQALPYTDRLYVTEYHEDREGDTNFPEFKQEFEEQTRHGLREYKDINYEWVDYVRK